ncbi:actin cytoskeleton-regulatory complex proteinpan1 [Lichtheimia corymbifera JMRC:FSU:9682]|uniref:Actin cytoskeleton-regulatory complex proteinpan1 n=1 Tax=Lichtheimia corymbifera JMRC:FSU:9682 TaxID=1263082 RepID=A0A068S275_9FUNG|nr:actin cytoskeleton-regulatory complex proteinpan1 [Lichtheimia corymbifera JMRC:FSU:9682]
MAAASPSIRLSFLAPGDQSKYESLFAQAAPSSKFMSAAQAREVLSRSGLDSETLARIWDLSNVTQEPQLTFPEFAVAMYLTSMRMTGRDIPSTLPDAIRNEIQTATAMIRSTADAVAPQPTGLRSSSSPSLLGVQPMPQRSNSTSMLQSLAKGQTIQSQPTGYQQSQPTGLQQPSFTGLQAQMTGVQPMPTGLQQPSMTGLASQPTGMLQQQQQPTGLQVPMITGVTPMMGNNIQVAMPTGMAGNNMDFTNQMMPDAQMGGNHQFQAITGKVKIPWAVTTEEKQRYSKVFKSWDTDNKGYISGDKAKEIFTQSGLAQNILMQIWNLSDPNNQGKLNVDEFCVAMHLIYRKLNGYDVPTSLPAELVPPSTRQLKETVSELKNSILQDIAKKRHLTNFSSSPSLSPPTTRGSPSRARSVSPGPTSSSSSSRRREKYVDNDDSEPVYVSSARRMGPDRSRWGQSRDGNGSPSPTASKSSGTTTSSYGYRGKATRISDMRKEIAQQKERLKQLEQEAISRKATPYNELSYTDRKDIDEVKEKIRELQSEIVRSGGDDEGGSHAWDKYSRQTTELADITEQEKSLESEIQYLIETSLRKLVQQLQETEEDLAEKKKQLTKLKASKESSSNSTAGLDIVGTGPNGEITESDRIRAKAKAMVAARMGKITGKSSTIDVTAELDAIDQEKMAFIGHADSVSAMIQDVEDQVNSVRMETSLLGLDIRKHEQDQKKIDERQRFEKGDGVAMDLKDFIQQLAFEVATAKAPDVDPSFESRFPSFEP